MCRSQQEQAHEDVDPCGDRPDWRQARACALTEARPIVEAVAAEMQFWGYPSQDVFAVRLALDEALVNAIRHGHKDAGDKCVQVRYQVIEEQVMVEIADEGPGFDPQAVPDPRSPENRERPGGRGVLLMRSFMTWVRFTAPGNRVTMCRRRSTP